MTITLAAPSTKDALVLGERRMSYNELLARAHHLKNELATYDSEQIIVFGENSLAWAVAAYGVWAAGKVLVPLDAQSKPDDFHYVLKDSEARIVFVSEDTRPIVEEALAELGDRPTVLGLDYLLEAEVENQPSRAIEGDTEDTARIATIIYTSGTTGDPKGVMLSFANLHANLIAVQKLGYFGPEERVLLLLPLHHVLPLMGCLLAPIATGGTVYLCPSLAKDDIVRVLNEGKITILIGVPRFFELLSGSIEDKISSSKLARLLFSLAKWKNDEGFSKRLFGRIHQGFGGHLRYMVSGGAPLNPHIVRLFQTLGFRLYEGYGMTECAPLITFPELNRPKPGYCGKPIFGATVELREGEVLVKGPQVMRGYFRRPKETAQVLEGGWLHTGDLGAFDADGDLCITGRRKEILVLPNGKNVNPALGEALLEEHEEVAEAGIFLDGDVLHALVVLHPEHVPRDEKDLETFIFSRAVRDHNQRVAPYRKISRVTVSAAPLPRTRLGKLRRHLLADEAQKNVSEVDVREPEKGAEQKLVRYLSHIGCRRVTVRSRLGADLGLDSMARLELREFLRSTLDTTIDESRLTDSLRVEELAQLVEDGNTTGDITQVNWKTILDEQVSIALPSTSALHVLILIALRLLTFLFVRLRVQGTHRLPEGPKLFAPNHQSALDGVFLTSSLRLGAARDVYFLAKEKHLKHPAVRFLARRGRIIILDEAAGLQASLQAVALALRRGKSVVVFPEGTRTKDGSLGDFKNSYAIVAHYAKVPIVPVVLQGAFDVLPRGSSWPRVGRRVHVMFLPAVEATEDPFKTNATVRELIAEKLS